LHLISSNLKTLFNESIPYNVSEIIKAFLKLFEFSLVSKLKSLLKQSVEKE
jgi:hypothetical protein